MKEQAAMALFDELLDLDATERAARLARIEADDPELAATLREWLVADAQADARVDQGPVATRVLPGAILPRTAAGDRIGAYRLVRELGRGGMGQVWLAERADGEFAQHVALKLIHPELAGPEAAPRFRRERQILADLRHPNIAQLIDGGVAADGQPWLAMEWVEGVSLREEMRRGPLSTRRVLALGAQIAEALAHAHAAGIVHRDLKP
jgi:serine/threonine protein kinase